MAELKNAFTGGIMNKDSDERLVQNGQFRDALNIDITAVEGSDAGAVRNKKGNTKIGDLANVAGFSTATAKTIGAISVELTNTIYYLVASDLFDGVYEFNELSGVITRILQSNKATPTTPSKLNFDKEYYVTGFNYIDDFLFWTDNLNEPFGGSIKRWKSYNIDDDRIDDDIRVIKPAPLNSPVIEMKNELDQENNIEERFLQFCYRFKYIDNQYSAFSPFSGVAFVPGNYQIDYAAGNNEAMQNTQNKVGVRFETGNQFVTDIELIFRDTKNLNTEIVESFSKDKLNIPDNFTYSFDFDNNKSYITLPNSQLTRLADNVPLKAKAQEIIGSRLLYGNYTQFYDVVDSNGKDIELDYTVDYVSEDTVAETGRQTFRSDRDLEVAIEYGDGDSRFTPGLTSKTNTTYIKPENSVTANSLLVKISNDPPAFASEYRLLIKQRKGDYYSIFPILYHSEGVYRYFLINESDRDKFKVGEYVIFKADGTGPTLSNDKYKILEFELKEESFLGGSEQAGLYFKIKIEGGVFAPSNVSTFSSTGTGANATSQGACNQGSKRPIEAGSEFKCADNPIFYGTSNAGAALAVVNSWSYGINDDSRFIFEIDGFDGNVNTYRYKVIGSNPLASSNPTWIQEDVPIVANTSVGITANGTSATIFTIQFSQDLGFDVGDSWRINGRGDINFAGTRTVLGDFLSLLSQTGVSNQVSQQHGGFAVIPGPSWSTTTPETDRVIQAGAQIEINIISDSNNSSQQAGVQSFTSSRRYENIEEWFYEDGIDIQFEQFDQGAVNIGSRSVVFRRGRDWSLGSIGNGVDVNEIIQGYLPTAETMSYPVRMFIRGYGTNNGCNQNVITASFKITQLDNPLICETNPIADDTDIFHEMTDTYPIVGGLHTVLWAYEDFTDPQNGSGYTRIGQAVPFGVPGTQRPHKFQVGNTIDVTSSNINGVFTIVEVEDAYNAIIDFAWPGSGPVTPGTAGLSHGSGTIELDQTISVPATIVINHPQNPNATYNGYTFGNGLESNRILDDFNATTLEYSPRVTTVIEDYQQDTKESSLSYSGVYKEESSINRFNEFNLSQANFKSLDKEFGSVQKLYARDTNIIVFQEDKVNQVMYGKNIMFDAVGGGNVTSTNEVLGQQTAFAGEWGISSNPESFAQWGNNIYFTDQRRGGVLKLTAGGIFDMAQAGMKSYFRDVMKDDPNTQKLGVYDPYDDNYILAINEDRSVPCQFSIEKTLKRYAASANDGIESVNDTRPDFIITSNTSWTITVAYSGGTGWVTGFPESGYGSQDVFLGIGDNNTGAIRTATLTITHCDGATTLFTINQGAGRKIRVVTWISSNQIQ